MNSPEQPRGENKGDPRFSPPEVSLPKGGGAIKGIGEKFASNPVTGTGSLSIPIPMSPGRSGFTPALALDYDSGSGNGPYGFGWNVGYPHITRRTDRGLPQYLDDQESDVYILSGAEDLVPNLNADGSRFEVERAGYRVTRYRPRIEGLFSRIERWANVSDAADSFWRTITRENVTTFFGKSPNSRIADPADPTRIFTWLLSESFDDKGNAVSYEYIAEDSRSVDSSLACEFNRTEANRSANRYLKRVKYGNRTPRLLEADLATIEWLFELVMDYGDHEDQNPGIDPTKGWPVRPDPFSTYRSGFEVRTYRRCRRFLMFHRFQELGPQPRLVRSLTLDYDDFVYPIGFATQTEIEYQGSTRLGSFLRRATSSGYADSGLVQSMPPLEITYSLPHISEEVRTLEDGSLENLAGAVDGTQYRWIDLNSEGVLGVLTEQGEAWWYKPNLGDGRLGPLQVVALKPSVSLGGRVEFMDLAGDGIPDLVQLNGLNTGFFKRDEEEGWTPFTPFTNQPNVQWGDPNLRFVDLTGDGHADILITEDDVIAWHPSLAEQGFGRRESLRMAADESAGPKLVFNDTTETIFLADMSGDGLADLVRIRNEEICYWPNLGYGRFGAKITMDDAPSLDAQELYEPRRVRLADIDGSGTIDLIYLAGDGVRIYFNRSGNGWSAPYQLANFPAIDNVAAISVTDLLGHGTACLVWSHSLPDTLGAPLQFVDLMANGKPHLIIGVENNLGARTVIQYTASTKFYLQDRLDGRPWITRLPFPVHVVERTETYDDISRNRFVSRFAYHHGYFDGIEREFRGFGMMEQWDTEEFSALTANDQLPPSTNIDASSHVPPVLTRTWFHTGNYFGAGRVSNSYAGEYYREPGLTRDQAKQFLLDDTLLPPGLTADEEREATRALKGSMLRQEVYALDGTDRQGHPYSVSEQNFTIRLTQRIGSNLHAVFFVEPRESIGYHYEREPADPRVAHSLTLEVDEFGNVLKAASVVYGRRTADPVLEARDQARQTELHITYAENHVTNAFDEPDAYRTPLLSEALSFELTGLSLQAGSIRFDVGDLINAGVAAFQIPYEQSATAGVLQKRLIEQMRTIYLGDDLTSRLPLGQVQSLGLPFEAYKLAFSPGLLAAVYGAKTTDTMLSGDGGYVHGEGDTQWWIPSGRVFFPPNTPQHFFLPSRFQDPFGNSTSIAYDMYDLLPLQTVDALGNTVIAEYDYRVLQPQLVTDPNGNRTAASFDALGMIVGTAVMGKANETTRRGDLLAGFVPDVADDVIAAHFAHPFADPDSLLKQASSRLMYDLFAYQRTKHLPKPAAAVVYTMVRETHDADLVAGQQTKIQHSFSYSDGFGREIQKKAQAEPGPIPQRNDNIKVDPRWVGSGWTIFNNKSKPVRQFEPFFTDTHLFEDDVRIGVSPVLFYDPVGRVVATLHPNHTWEKVIFDPWRQESWDVNDTVLIDDPKGDENVGNYFSRLAESEYLPTWYAQRQDGALGPEEQAAAAKTAVHAATPSVAHSDSLGRTFLTIAHNKFQRSNENSSTEEFYAARVNFDIEGNQRAVIDAKERIVMRYEYDMLGNRVHQASMEAGERWMLTNVVGKPIFSWDSRDNKFRTIYDALLRPTDSFLREGAGPELLIGRTIYGESRPSPELTNQRGKVIQVFDQAGVVISGEYDFKGNLLGSSRQLAKEYKATADWSGNVPLEADVYASSTAFNALNRPTEQIAPDASRLRHVFNAANLLERVEANLRGDLAVTTPFVNNIDYDSKGRRTLIEYGNGVKTTYDYDPLTFRLTRLGTTRDAALFAGDCPQPPRTDWPGCGLQDLNYTYDASGNITRIRDDAQQIIYFRNQRVEPSSDYIYDATYRLTEASGREHLGQNGDVPTPDPFDTPRTHLLHPGDGTAMGRYIERYVYDGVGNFQSMQHVGSWTRTYAYNEASQLEPLKQSNRLSSTTVGQVTDLYHYEGSAGLHGDMTSMPHLPLMQWNFHDQLQASSRQVVTDGSREITWYVYDASGQRARKVTELANGARKEERAYLGGFEVYRKYDGSGATVTMERESLHVMDDKQRVAVIETRTQGTDESPAQLIRYQFGNHLGSASLELDDHAQIISCEEYYPYGSTSYQAGRTVAEVSLKRYRYTGMERDEETGLAYHGARHCAPWLGRWTAADPSGLNAGINLYGYANGNPVRYSDRNGADPDEFLPGLIPDYPHLGQAWRSAAETVLENKYALGTYAKNEAALFADLSKIAPGPGRTEFARGIFNSVREGFYRRVGKLYKSGIDALGDIKLSDDVITKMIESGSVPVRGAQIDHAIFELAEHPHRSLDPWNLGIRKGHARVPGGSHYTATEGRALSKGLLGHLNDAAILYAGATAAIRAGGRLLHGDFRGAAREVGSFAYDQTVGVVVDAASLVKDFAKTVSDPLSGVRESVELLKQQEDEEYARLSEMLGGDEQPAPQPSAPPPIVVNRQAPQEPNRGNLAQSLALWTFFIGVALSSSAGASPSEAPTTQASSTGASPPAPRLNHPLCQFWTPTGIPFNVPGPCF